MASTGEAAVISNGAKPPHETECEPKDLPQLQLRQAEQDMSKPARPAPKVFASPRKRSETQVRPQARNMARSKSMKGKLRKALAPYLTSTYLQGEIAKHFTKEFLAAHPPPENEEDLPEYVQQHLSELTRVTERWTGCVMRALDPLTHEWEVDEKLELARAREEGRLRKAPAGEWEELHGAGGRKDLLEGDEDLDDDLDEPPHPEGGLTTSQLFGAVHLVSDIKVWEQILAAQRAEERRQHAIAELHLHHAARIIQRSWRGFITQKKQEKARLDALVSPDVQAMLSAAAYKAMRDARNKLAVMKLRKSLSRKCQGFGSATPRDLAPIPRVGTSGPMQPLPASPRRQRGSMGSIQCTPRLEGGDSESGKESATSPARVRPLSRSVTTDARSFAARSARVITRLVSMKDLSGDPGRAGEGAAPGGDDGLQYTAARLPRRTRLRATGALSGEGEAAGKQREVGEDGQIVKEVFTSPRPPRHFRLSSGAAPKRRYKVVAVNADGAEEGGQGAGEGGAGGADGHEGAYGGLEDEDDGEDEDEDFDSDEFEDEDDSDSSTCVSGSEVDEGESAEAAMAEAEEVVQVAAELAKALLGARDSGSESSDDDDDKQGYQTHMGNEALMALSAMEEAAAGPGGPPGSKAGALASLLAPSSLQAAALEAAEAAQGTAAASGSQAAGAGAGTSTVHRGRSMTQDANMLRQLIAGALAAAAAPLLGRKNALAVAQMGLGDLLQMPGAKGLLPKAAAAVASARPAPGVGQLAAVGRGAHHLHPLEVRAQAVPPLGVPARGKAAGGGGAGSDRLKRASDSGIAPSSPLAPTAASKEQIRATRKTISGDPVEAAANDNSSTRDLSAASWRSSPTGLPAGGGVTTSGGGVVGSSPRSSPTGISAAAAAARATQPWATPRRISHPPGAHTMASALPDPRGGGARDSGRPRDPSWLLPPIPVNRSSAGPAGIGGVAAALAAAAAAAAAGANLVVPRVPSDPNLQRPSHMQGAVAGLCGGGAAAAAAGAQAVGGPGAMAAAAAAAAVGRARASLVASSVDSSLQQLRQQTGFVISSLVSPSAAAQRGRLSVLGPSDMAPAFHQQQQQPLQSSLAGGVGGVGGRIPTGRQGAPVQYHGNAPAS